MVVEKLRQLLAQALVLLALVTEQHGALEQLLLQIVRQFAPQIRRGGTEHEQIASGNVFVDLIGMFAHWRTHNCKELITVRWAHLLNRRCLAQHIKSCGRHRPYWARYQPKTIAGGFVPIVIVRRRPRQGPY